MAKHSSAPWKVETRIIEDESSTPLQSISIVDSDGNLVINTVNAAEDKTVAGNMELMALAPELAWALIEILDYHGPELTVAAHGEYIMDRATILYDKVYRLVRT